MTAELYNKLQDAVGFEVGDFVKLAGTAEDQQFGWQSEWNYEMTQLWENDAEGEITGIEGAYGIVVLFDDGNDYYFPFFALEKVEGTRVRVELNDEYTAIVSADGVKVGCQNIELSVIDELVKAKRRVLKNK